MGARKRETTVSCGDVPYGRCTRRGGVSGFAGAVIGWLMSGAGDLPERGAVLTLNVER
jgi:hypothetical protein